MKLCAAGREEEMCLAGLSDNAVGACCVALAQDSNCAAHGKQVTYAHDLYLSRVMAH